MKGGEISGNGVSGKPGSGIFTLNMPNATITTPFILSGKVIISNNPIAFYANTSPVCPSLGSKFINDNPGPDSAIPVILFTNATGAVTFKSRWKAGQQFLTSLESDSVSDKVQDFTLTGCYYIHQTNMDSTAYKTDEVNYSIGADGKIVDNNAGS
jgi:hypothetical protein